MAIQAKTKTIVDVAQQAAGFTVLVDALKAADLVETLQGKGPFTVFAPTDEAFNKLPKETLTGLLKPENKEELQAILKNHVVAGRMAARDVIGEASIETLQSNSLPVRAKGDVVRIGEATITQTDIEADNGLIHAINTVLLPNEEK
ncbi:MAG: fasciclin domain-containing protein [Bacteroidetes bacterium]|jgi:uncharacterized surface protein with fasciclin (FAS1) repeats|nr:fasciclin domain-containing protein [Bacteroidota bacterium]